MKSEFNLIIADDHTLFRKGLKSLLSDFSFIGNIAEASNGKEAISLLKSSNANIDIVLLDLNMPVMDGVQATEEIRSFNKDVKILILTMEDDQRLIIRMIEKGINGYLFKNISPLDLEKALKNVITKEFYFDDEISQLVYKTVIQKSQQSFQEESFIKLTNRELEVLELICKEFTAAEIAEKLFISTRTVEGHRSNLFQKTGVKNTAGLVVYAIKNDLVEI
ncbi:MAG: response regulator [Hyphomicrobiales bacterium]